MYEVGSRIYYLKNNGTVILITSEFRGYGEVNTIDDDFMNYKVLSELNREKVGVFELDYGELGRRYRDEDADSIRVDYIDNVPTLIFFRERRIPDTDFLEDKSVKTIINEELEKAKTDLTAEIIKIFFSKDEVIKKEDIKPLELTDNIGGTFNSDMLKNIFDSSDLPNMVNIEAGDIPPMPNISELDK